MVQYLHKVGLLYFVTIINRTSLEADELLNAMWYGIVAYLFYSLRYAYGSRAHVLLRPPLLKILEKSGTVRTYIFSAPEKARHQRGGLLQWRLWKRTLSKRRLLSVHLRTGRHCPLLCAGNHTLGWVSWFLRTPIAWPLKPQAEDALRSQRFQEADSNDSNVTFKKKKRFFLNLCACTVFRCRSLYFKDSATSSYKLQTCLCILGRK